MVGDVYFSVLLDKFYDSMIHNNLYQAYHYGELSKCYAYEFYYEGDLRIALGLANYLTVSQELGKDLPYDLLYKKVFDIYEKYKDEQVEYLYIYGCALYNYALLLIGRGDYNKGEKHLEHCLEYYRIMVINAPSEFNILSYLQAVRELISVKKSLNKDIDISLLEEFFKYDENYYKLLIENDLLKINGGSHAN